MRNDNALQSYKAQLHPISMGVYELHNELQEKNSVGDITILISSYTTESF